MPLRVSWDISAGNRAFLSGTDKINCLIDPGQIFRNRPLPCRTLSLSSHIYFLHWVLCRVSVFDLQLLDHFEAQWTYHNQIENLIPKLPRCFPRLTEQGGLVAEACHNPGDGIRAGDPDYSH